MLVETLERRVGDKFIEIDEAVRVSGMHAVTLKRLMRSGELKGHKAVVDGRRRWVISERSLKAYANGSTGFFMELSGSKISLIRRSDLDWGELPPKRWPGPK